MMTGETGLRSVTIGWPGRRARIVATWAAHGVVAGVFAAAAGFKLVDPAKFATDIGHYRLVPPVVAGAAAVYLPWLELALAAALLAPRWRRAARWVAGAVLVGFCAALASTLWRGIDVRCGCFGEGSATGPGWALARNAALLGCLALGAWAVRPAKTGV